MVDHLAAGQAEAAQCPTIRTGNEAFDKQFNLSSDDEQEALRILESQSDGSGS